MNPEESLVETRRRARSDRLLTQLLTTEIYMHSRNTRLASRGSFYRGDIPVQQPSLSVIQKFAAKAQSGAELCHSSTRSGTGVHTYC